MHVVAYFCLASTLDFQQHDKRVRVIIMDNPLILAMPKNNLAPNHICLVMEAFQRMKKKSISKLSNQLLSKYVKILRGHIWIHQIHQSYIQVVSSDVGFHTTEVSNI